MEIWIIHSIFVHENENNDNSSILDDMVNVSNRIISIMIKNTNFLIFIFYDPINWKNLENKSKDILV